MKKRILALAVAVLMLSTVAFAGPFVAWNVELAQTPSFTANLTVGYKVGGFTGSFTATNVFSADHTLDFDASMKAGESWWDSVGTFGLKDISLDPNPIESAALGWLGTVHLGDLLTADSGLSTFTLDLYGGFDVEYQFITPAWIPSGRIGFYWELK